MQELTEDTILNGKIKLFQPKNGYRVAIDPIILSSFVKLGANQKILDVGCGVGTISLILKTREEQSEITAIDMDKEMCEICKQNSILNSLDINVVNFGIENLKRSPMLTNKLFDQVVTNPPFFKKESSRISESKRYANYETIKLSNWIASCFKRLKNNGTFSIIHRVSCIGDILNSLENIAGAIEIIPIFSKKNHEAKRIVVQAKKFSKSETKIFPGIVTHDDDGNYSKIMREILAGSLFEFKNNALNKCLG